MKLSLAVGYVAAVESWGLLLSLEKQSLGLSLGLSSGRSGRSSSISPFFPKGNSDILLLVPVVTGWSEPEELFAK